MQRLAGLLGLTGAAIFGVAAILVSRLDRQPATGSYRLPGGAALDAAALTVLLIGASVFAVCGLAALLFTPPVPRISARVRPGSRRPSILLLLGVVTLLAVLALRHFGL